MQVKIVGYIFGEASGWDSYDDYGYQVYDFKSSVANMPDGSCVSFNLFSGDVSYYNKDGDVTLKMQLLDILKTL